MKAYNLYLGTTRITKLPISKPMKDKIETMEYVYKQAPDGQRMKIPTKKLRSVECVII